MLLVIAEAAQAQAAQPAQAQAAEAAQAEAADPIAEIAPRAA